MRIAIATDLHFANQPAAIPARRSELADRLLTAVVRELNDSVRADLLLLPGDILDNGAAPDACELRRRIARVLAGLRCPHLILPGNHDGDATAFRAQLSWPEPWLDAENVRFVPFVDEERPGFNAWRAPADLARLAAARAGFDGTLVAVQHVCLAPPERNPTPYNYVNADEVIAVMRAAGVALSISGHHHPGAEPVETDGITFLTAPALCEKPFPYTVLELDGTELRVTSHHSRFTGNEVF